MTRSTPLVTPLELRYSRPVALFVLVLAVGALLSQGTALIGLTQLRGLAPIALLALLAFAPVYWLLFRYVFRALSQQEPVVVLDEHGIHDVRQRQSFVAWDDVQRVRLGSGDKAHYLCLDYTVKAAGRLQSRLGGWWAMLWRVGDTLGDWNVYLLTLSGRRREIERHAEALRRAAIRRRVERLNAAAAPAARVFPKP